MGNIKQEIISDLGPEINAHKDDANSWGRRNFGLYIEASKKYVLHYQGNQRKMRAFAIRNFTEMVAFEYDCSYGHAQKCVVALADKEILASYTNLLIADAIEQFN